MIVIILNYDNDVFTFVACPFNLLAATSTASAKELTGPAACYTGVHALAESVHQNCMLERCANLCFIIVLHLPSLFFFFFFFFLKIGTWPKF